MVLDFYNKVLDSYDLGVRLVTSLTPLLMYVNSILLRMGLTPVVAYEVSPFLVRESRKGCSQRNMLP